MNIRVERRAHVTVIAIAGSVDGATAPALVASFREEVSGGFIRIVGDFSGVEYTSSAGLRALLETVKETRQRGGDLRLAAVQPDVLAGAGSCRIHGHFEALRQHRRGRGELSGAERVSAAGPAAGPRNRIAVVIGSGSVKCAAALGMFKVLQREAIPIDMVVGCSGGALYAAFVAMGHELASAEAKTRQLWTREITQKRNTRALLSAMLPKIFGFDERFGLVDDRLVLERLRRGFGDARFEDAKIPLHLTATDFFTGEQVVFSSGGVVDAIRASIAIPYIFQPWKIGDRTYVDGFLSDPMPIGVAIKEGADVIITMGFESPYQTRITSVMRFAFQLSSITSNNLLKANYAFHNLAHHHEILPIIPQFQHKIHLFDTDRIPYVIEEGERATEKQIPYLRQLLAPKSA